MTAGAASLSESLPFDPANARAALDQLPAKSAVFALCFDEGSTNKFPSVGQGAEPYIGRTPNLRGRLERLLQPSAKHLKRLQLASRVRQIRWRLTGSDFESLLVQFSLLERIYGAKTLERMHLKAPAFIRFLGSNATPRLTVTHRPSQREAAWAYGPFASRAAAERFADETLKLFLLRRCTEQLHPDSAHPGCVYAEMKKCLAPCCLGCTKERYAEEAAAVERFLATRGESLLNTLRARRDEASDRLEFEAAAELHAQVARVESVRALAAELIRPLSQLRAVILQASANPDEVAVFLYEDGRLCGPEGFSTLGMRIQNEHSGSTSLFAQPVAIEAIPEAPVDVLPVVVEPVKIARGVLEARMEAALAALKEPSQALSPTLRQGHLALVKRWYYRPEARRSGEIFFPDADGRWPLKTILRGVGRVFASGFKPPVSSSP
jgi:excinuclease ABC subunit C